MREFDERSIRWLVRGPASGEPLTAEAASDALNLMLTKDRKGTSDMAFGCEATGTCRRGLLRTINDILLKESPASGVVAASIDMRTGLIEWFEPIHVNFYAPPQFGVSPDVRASQRPRVQVVAEEGLLPGPVQVPDAQLPGGREGA